MQVEKLLKNIVSLRLNRCLAITLYLFAYLSSFGLFCLYIPTELVSIAQSEQGERLSDGFRLMFLFSIVTGLIVSGLLGVIAIKKFKEEPRVF